MLALAPPPSGVRLLGSEAVERPPSKMPARRPTAHAHCRARDEALVRSTLNGDPSAPAEIVRRYEAIVRRSLCATLRGADLDDGVQNAFARAFENLARLRDPGSLRSFLIGIALRLAAMERRQRRQRWRERLTSTGELPDLAGHDPSAEALLVASRTRELLGRLPPQGCRILELRLVHEKELTEVAAAMGVSLATAKRHLARLSSRVRAMAVSEPVVAEYVRDALGA